MKSRILTLLVLLCTVVQTSWAIDVWDGSTKRPEYLPGRKVIIIRTAAELAYAQQHWDDDSGDGVRYELCHSHHDDEDDDVHVHFYCEKCHRTFCLEDTPVPPVSIPEGFEPRTVNYLLKGICPDCR